MASDKKLFAELSAQVSQWKDSQVAAVVFEEVRVFHDLHRFSGKAAVASIREWLEQHGVEP